MLQLAFQDFTVETHGPLYRMRSEELLLQRRACQEEASKTPTSIPEAQLKILQVSPAVRHRMAVRRSLYSQGMISDVLSQKQNRIQRNMAESNCMYSGAIGTERGN